jgi:putative phosphoribosyl transferase
MTGGDAPVAVRAPTLLIVGSLDQQVLELNKQAAQRMTAPTRIDVVQGASHLFEEPGALREVARRAVGWFDEHLGE